MIHLISNLNTQKYPHFALQPCTSWNMNPSFFNSSSWVIYHAQISHHVGPKISTLWDPKNKLSVWFHLIGDDWNWEKLTIVCLSIWFHLVSFFLKNNGFRAIMYRTFNIDLFIRYNLCQKYLFPRSIFIDIKWKNLSKTFFFFLPWKSNFWVFLSSYS